MSKGFNKHTHSLTFTKVVPKFLQSFGGAQPEASKEVEEAVRAARVRPSNDDELPTIANMDEFLRSEGGAVDQDQLRALVKTDEEGGEAKLELAPRPQDEPEPAPEPQFGRHLRVEDAEADALEEQSGRHVYRPRASGQKRKAAAVSPSAETGESGSSGSSSGSKGPTLDEVVARYLEEMGEPPKKTEEPPAKKAKVLDKSKAKKKKTPAAGGLSFSMDED